MESFVVKLKETGKYFKVEFSFYNTIDKLTFTKNKKNATIFQYGSLVVKTPSRVNISMGNMRIRVFSEHLYHNGITNKDITMEEFDAPEQSWMSKRQRK